MKYKLELDFQMWRYLTFALLAITVSGAAAFWTIRNVNQFASNIFGIAGLGFFILLIICSIAFFITYAHLRTKLED